MPKLQQPQRPPQAQQPPTNGASAESTINEFTSLLIQTASHGGFRYLQGLWKDNQELQQKYDEKHGAYKVNLKQLNASEAELESTKDALNSLKAERAATDGILQETKDDRDKFRQKSHEALEKQNSLLIRGNKLQKQIEALEKGLGEAKGEIEKGLKLQELLRKEQVKRQNVQDEVNRLTSFSASMVEYDEVKRDTL
jgi:predicted  nucleic acid-binding Zn-ribbon protein